MIDKRRSRDANKKGNSKCNVTMADQEGPFFEAGKITIQFASIQKRGSSLIRKMTR